ncbi:MAG TPA: hypothetical protein VGE29_00830 [Prosthecobacter sp.]
MLQVRRSRLRWLAVVSVILGTAVFWLIWFVMAPPEARAPVPVAKTPLASKPSPPPAAPVAKPLPQEVADPRTIDPEIQRLADRLAAKEESPVRDLEIVGEFIELYRKVFQQGNPIGGNEDITSVLTGHNASKGVLFPPGSPMIVKGQLVDRWGTPYWFHPSNSFQMEIRSAGPDKDLFTRDDVVINPGPDNMGIGDGPKS